MRRKILCLVLFLHLASVAIVLVEVSLDGFVDSAIYNLVQAIRSDQDSQQPDIWVNVGYWLINWWFPSVALTQMFCWMTALLLAATEPGSGKWMRIIWCVAIFLLWLPAIFIYCLVKLWPGNSLKPTPLRDAL